MKDWGTYRKLYESLPPDFERLPYAVRCFAAEVLRRCDRIGRVVPGDELNDKLVADLAFHVRAHTGEEEFLRRTLEALLADGYLVFRAGYLTIRNFVEAQRSDSADRMARKRERDRKLNELYPAAEPAASDASDVTDVTTRARASSGFVSSGLVLTPDLASTGTSQKPGSTRARPAPEKPVPLPADWEPSDSQVAALATKHGVSEARIRAAVPEFRWYWREGNGARRKSRATLRGWAQTFGNRIDDEATRGTLYAEPRPVQAPPVPQSGPRYQPQGEDAEARRTRRNNLIEDAKAGRYGREIALRARRPGEDMGRLADELENAPAPGVARLLATVGRSVT